MEDNNQKNTNDVTAAGAPDTPTTPSVTDTVTEVATAPVEMTPVTVPAADSAAVEVAPELVVPTADVAPEVIAESVVSEASTQRSTVVKQYAIALGIVVVMVGGVFYALVQQGRIQTKAFDKITAMVMPVQAAAVVNSVKISMVDYEKNKAQIEQSATQGGADPKDPTTAEQIKTQALDVLINTELLRQEATKAGVVVTKEQIDARYAEIVKSLEGEDKLAARMKELNITKEGLMSDISSEILIQTFLAKAVDTSSIKITPEDIKATYDKANTGPDAKLPPLDQVSSAIEAQLRQSKEQELISAYIQKLRDGAKVDIKVK